FGLMVRTLIWLFRAIIVRGNLDYRGVIAQVLFMLVMVEVVLDYWLTPTGLNLRPENERA
ncbi:MAG TPA: hypothetical protein VGP65_14955, partial [Candidatus Angelobacter sp.]|nr:hypothetical protein [Candidatus Angelobacter sp.]